MGKHTFAVSVVVVIITAFVAPSAVTYYGRSTPTEVIYDRYEADLKNVRTYSLISSEVYSTMSTLNQQQSELAASLDRGDKELEQNRVGLYRSMESQQPLEFWVRSARCFSDRTLGGRPMTKRCAAINTANR